MCYEIDTIISTIAPEVIDTLINTIKTTSDQKWYNMPVTGYFISIVSLILAFILGIFANKKQMNAEVRKDSILKFKKSFHELYITYSHFCLFHGDITEYQNIDKSNLAIKHKAFSADLDKILIKTEDIRETIFNTEFTNKESEILEDWLEEIYDNFFKLTDKFRNLIIKNNNIESFSKKLMNLETLMKEERVRFTKLRANNGNIIKLFNK